MCLQNVRSLENSGLPPAQVQRVRAFGAAVYRWNGAAAVIAGLQNRNIGGVENVWNQR